MANTLLLVAIILAGASFTAFTAVDSSEGWATSICSAAPLFCGDSTQMAYAAIVLGGIRNRT